MNCTLPYLRYWLVVSGCLTADQLYVQQLLNAKVPLEFFIEGTRSRTGKCLKPKLGLLGMITESFYTNQVEDICFVPVHINYERLVEAEVYPNELLGVPKRRESLAGLIEARSILSEDYGRISLKIDKPISLKEYTRSFASTYPYALPDSDPKFDPFVSNSDRRLLNLKLGHKIIYDINCQAVWSAVSLVSAVLLANRYGITQQKLVDTMEWLQSELIASACGNPDWLLDQNPSALVEKGLSGLTHAILTRRDGLVMPDVDSESCLMLSIYKNKLIHAFMRPAAVCLALVASSRRNSPLSQEQTEGSDIFHAFTDDVIDEAKFSHELLDLEVIYKVDPDSVEDFEGNIEALVRSGVLERKGRLLSINPVEKDKFYFYCHILWPFIESYWVTGTSLLG